MLVQVIFSIFLFWVLILIVVRYSKQIKSYHFALSVCFGISVICNMLLYFFVHFYSLLVPSLGSIQLSGLFFSCCFLMLLQPFGVVLKLEKIIKEFIKNSFYSQQISFLFLQGLWAISVPEVVLYYTLGSFISVYFLRTLILWVVGCIKESLNLSLLLLSYAALLGVALVIQFSTLVIFWCSIFVLIFFLKKKYVKNKLENLPLIKDLKKELYIQQVHMMGEFKFFYNVSKFLSLFCILNSFFNLLKFTDWLGLASVMPTSFIYHLPYLIWALNMLVTFLVLLLMVIRTTIIYSCNPPSIVNVLKTFAPGAVVMGGFVYLNCSHITIQDVAININSTLLGLPKVVSKETLGVQLECLIQTDVEKVWVLKCLDILGSKPPLIEMEISPGVFKKVPNISLIQSMLKRVDCYNGNYALSVRNITSTGGVGIPQSMTGAQVIATSPGEPALEPLNSLSSTIGAADARIQHIETVLKSKDMFYDSTSSKEELPGLVSQIAKERSLVVDEQLRATSKPVTLSSLLFKNNTSTSSSAMVLTEEQIAKIVRDSK